MKCRSRLQSDDRAITKTSPALVVSLPPVQPPAMALSAQS